jgi:hypothetical protein
MRPGYVGRRRGLVVVEVEEEGEADLHKEEDEKHGVLVRLSTVWFQFRALFRVAWLSIATSLGTNPGHNWGNGRT